MVCGLCGGLCMPASFVACAPVRLSLVGCGHHCSRSSAVRPSVREAESWLLACSTRFYCILRSIKYCKNVCDDRPPRLGAAGTGPPDNTLGTDPRTKAVRAAVCTV